MPRIGVVFYRVPVADISGANPFFLVRVLRESLARLGWTEGRTIEILWRSAQGSNARVEEIVVELIRERVDVLALSGNSVIEAAKSRTRRIPIVMLGSTMPVESKLVESLGRPGGNITGIAETPMTELFGKRLDILRQAAPNARRVALLHDGIQTPAALSQSEAMAAGVGVALLPYPVDTARQLEDAMREAAASGAQAVYSDTSYGIAPAEQPQIRAMVVRHRLPTIHRFGHIITAGFGLMAYEADVREEYRRAAVFIDRILRGADPAGLPVEQGIKHRLSINVKLAESIGWKIPPALLLQADEIVRLARADQRRCRSRGSALA